MKRIALLIALLLVTQNQIFAKYCYSNKDITVSWGAFKTPAKAKVSGKLTSLKINAKNKANSIKDILRSASISIDTNVIASGDKSRDMKIAKFFFSTMTGGSKIDAKIKKVTNKKITLSVTMNGKTLDVPMSYQLKGNTLSSKGYIDVLDFGMSEELSAINKACKALHEGKTWSDVEIQLNAKFTNC